MKRLAHIGFLALFLFFAATPWIVIHTCGEATDVDLMSASAEDPCGCADEREAVPCCTLEVRTFHLDDARPVVPAVSSLEAGIAVALLPVMEAAPIREPRQAPSQISVHPPGSPPLQILHCAFLV